MIGAGFNIDQEKWWKFYNNSEEAMNWLIDKMEAAGYTTALERNNREVNNGPMNVPVAAHSWINDEMTTVGMGAGFVADTLTKTADASGVQIVWQMIAKQLVRDDNNTGRV